MTRLLALAVSTVVVVTLASGVNAAETPAERGGPLATSRPTPARGNPVHTFGPLVTLPPTDTAP